MKPISELNEFKSFVIDIDTELTDLRSKLNNHKIYQSLKSINDIKIFMEHHIFAVWDFMSILKALQIELTCVSIPWIPQKNPKMVRFINEIVYAEESDVNELGDPKSHFEMYMDAMTQIKADKAPIESFINSFKSGLNISSCIDNLHIEKGVKNFIHNTFNIINSKKPHCIASAFTYGREDIIPDMFIEILNELDPDNLNYNKFKYYLDRHIEIDGEQHGPISKKMVKELCGKDLDKWDEAVQTARTCIKKRIHLWDAIYNVIMTNDSVYLNT
tara:strand:- start:2124 stop:2942 length:819 start_codon:yes stop_codon:yes gene_type:complete